MKKTLKSVLFGLVGLFISFQLMAAPVGVLVVEKGIIKLRRNTIDRIIRESDREIPVEAKDEIQTGKTTRVKLMLREKNETILLFSNSFFSVSSVVDEGSEVSLPIGKIRCIVTPTLTTIKKAKRHFRVRTITAIVGVKGSDFVVQSDGISTNLLTIEGVIGFANVESPEVSVDVTKNQASKTTTDAPPTPPADVPPEVAETIATQDTTPEWEGVEFNEPPAPPPADEGEEETQEEDQQQEDEEEPEQQTEPEPELPPGPPPIPEIPEVTQPSPTDLATDATVKFKITEE